MALQDPVLPTIVSFLALGFLSAVVIDLLDTEEVNGGSLATVVAGVIGALFGGFVVNAFLGAGAIGLDLTSVALAITGAVIFSLLERLLLKKNSQEEEEKPLLYNDDLVYYHQIDPGKAMQRYQKIEKLLQEMSYPSSKMDILRHAEKQGADEIVLTKLEKIPNHIYSSKFEIDSELEKTA